MLDGKDVLPVVFETKKHFIQRKCKAVAARAYHKCGGGDAVRERTAKLSNEIGLK